MYHTTYPDPTRPTLQFLVYISKSTVTKSDTVEPQDYNFNGPQLQYCQFFLSQMLGNNFSAFMAVIQTCIIQPVISRVFSCIDFIKSVQGFDSLKIYLPLFTFSLFGFGFRRFSLLRFLSYVYSIYYSYLALQLLVNLQLSFTYPSGLLDYVADYEHSIYYALQPMQIDPPWYLALVRPALALQIAFSVLFLIVPPKQNFRKQPQYAQKLQHLRRSYLLKPVTDYNVVFYFCSLFFGTFVGGLLGQPLYVALRKAASHIQGGQPFYIQSLVGYTIAALAVDRSVVPFLIIGLVSLRQIIPFLSFVMEFGGVLVIPYFAENQMISAKKKILVKDRDSYGRDFVATMSDDHILILHRDCSVVQNRLTVDEFIIFLNENDRFVGVKDSIHYLMRLILLNFRLIDAI